MSTVNKTRSGRISKKPASYVPEEVPEDDFSENEHDEDYIAGDTDLSESEEEDFSDDDDADADENGNLKDFVVDDSESDEED